MFDGLFDSFFSKCSSRSFFEFIFCVEFSDVRYIDLM